MALFFPINVSLQNSTLNGKEKPLCFVMFCFVLSPFEKLL